ncbi:MAG: hypothetical protein SAJ12_10445 [Jaaginema sp. PMC 1079.18]|nr:hypothetical protein [Jaaginema sp. PMC 1080.18]MEC4851420.1 hypothetical protein [Jaaginema sp. PMC 1079.18]MEC4866198.1 hypothetical protein [Jaaginema sp. PMC 1078.18]
MAWLLRLAVTIALINYIVGIVAVKSGCKLKPPKPTPTRSQNLPPQVQDYFRETIPEVKALGFQSLGFLTWVDEANNGTQTFYMSICYQPKEKTLLVDYVAFNENTNGLTQTNVRDLATFFADGHEALTSTSSENLYPLTWTRTYKTDLRFPEEKNLQQLFEKQRKLAAWVETQRQTEKVAPVTKNNDTSPIQQVAESLYNFSLGEYQHFCRLGQFYRESGQEVFRFTWKGAIICTVRLLPPGKQIVNILRKRHYESFWRKISRT